MVLPEKLESVVHESLNTVREHPLHEYGPANRKKLIDVYFELKTPTADLARRWLAVLSAKQVQDLYVEPNYPERYYDQIKEFPPDEWQQVQEQILYIDPREALKLAEQVLRGEFDTDKARNIANETHYYIGYWKRYQPAPAVFAEIAGNRALGEAAWPERNPFWNLEFYGQSIKSDLDWVLNAIGDAAASAFVSQCCGVSAGHSDKEREEGWDYDRWVKNLVIDPQKALEFWQWWLLQAVQQAWKIAEDSVPQD